MWLLHVVIECAELFQGFFWRTKNNEWSKSYQSPIYIYSLFQLSRPRFGSRSSRRRSQHILCTHFAYLRHSKKRAFGLFNSELNMCIAGSLPRRERVS